MAQTVAEWLEQQAQRTLSSQKAEADAGKLLTTFAAAIAATVVASALQVGHRPALDEWAAWLLAACVALTVIVVFLDRLRAPNHGHILTLKAVNGWSESETLGELRKEELTAEQYNYGVLTTIRKVIACQLLLATAAGVTAGTSLLVPAA